MSQIADGTSPRAATRRQSLATSMLAGALLAFAVSADVASAAPSARAACSAKDRPGGVRVRAVPAVSATASRFVTATNDQGTALYRCSPDRQLVRRLAPRVRIARATTTAGWTGWVAENDGRAELLRRSPGGRVQRRRLPRPKEVTGLAIAFRGDVIVLRARKTILLTERWSAAGRFVRAKLDREIGPVQQAFPERLWMPDNADVLIDGPAPPGTSPDQSTTSALVLGLPRPAGGDRCRPTVAARTQRSNNRWTVQLADRWLRACDRRTGQRRYVETYSPGDIAQDGDQPRSIEFSSLDLVDDSLVARVNESYSHYGEGVVTYTVVNLKTGTRSRAGAREIKPSYFPTGVGYARLETVGQCLEGTRTVVPAPSDETLFLASGFTVQQNVYGTSVPSVASTVTTRTSLSYVDAAGSHDQAVDQDRADPAAGAVRITDSQIIVRANGTTKTITPVPFSAPSASSAVRSC